MFLNSTFSGIEATAHRQTLLAEAEHYRLVKIARAGRRAARAGTRVTTPPPPPPPPTVGPEQLPRDHDENRRYAVSR